MCYNLTVHLLCAYARVQLDFVHVLLNVADAPCEKDTTRSVEETYEDENVDVGNPSLTHVCMRS